MIFKKINLFVCFIVLWAMPSSGHAMGAYDFTPMIPKIEKGSDFRGFIWGVTKKDVKRYERAIFYKEEGDSLYYLETPSEYDFRRLIKYDFLNNALVGASYSFEELTHPDANNIVDMYEHFKRNISFAFGQSKKEDFIWRDKLYQRYPEYWNSAIRSGDLKISSRWIVDKITMADLTLGFDSPYYSLTYKVKKGEVHNVSGMLPISNISTFGFNP